MPIMRNKLSRTFDNAKRSINFCIKIAGQNANVIARRSKHVFNNNGRMISGPIIHWFTDALCGQFFYMFTVLFQVHIESQSKGRRLVPQRSALILHFSGAVNGYSREILSQPIASRH